jgi:CO/xanthine dehydrogenase Mo-binding subunit
MYGGIAQGLGYARLEDMTFQNGYPQSLNFDGYLIPTALDIPPVEATFIEVPFAEGPYGAKNMAEPLLIAAAPAVANAIFQATGQRLRALPMTMERVLLGHALTPSGAEQQCRVVLGARPQ